MADHPHDNTIRVGHIVRELCPSISAFTYRIVTNASPTVYNSVFCNERTNADAYPHPAVSTAQSSSFIRDFVGRRISSTAASEIAGRLRKTEWRRYLAKYRPDVLHVQHGTHAVRCLKLLKTADRPILVTFHGSDINCATFNQQYLDSLREVFATADQLHFVARHLLDAAVKLGADHRKCELTYLGVDPLKQSNTQHTDSIITIGCIASLVPCKGHETLLRAFNSARRTCRNLKLRLFGDGPMRDRINWLINDLKLHDYVKLHGRTENAAVRRTLESGELDIVALTSQQDDKGAQEGLPISLCEAAHAGIPCVGTNCGGIPEIIQHNLTGYIAPQRDIEAIARAIELFASDPQLRQSFGKAARQHAIAQHDSARQDRLFEEMYRSCINRFKSRTAA